MLRDPVSTSMWRSCTVVRTSEPTNTSVDTFRERTSRSSPSPSPDRGGIVVSQSAVRKILPLYSFEEVQRTARSTFISRVSQPVFHACTTCFRGVTVMVPQAYTQSGAALTVPACAATDVRGRSPQIEQHRRMRLEVQVLRAVMAFCIGARRAPAGPGDSIKQLSLQRFVYRNFEFVWVTHRRALSPVSTTLGLIHLDVIDTSVFWSTIHPLDSTGDEFVTAARGA